MSSVCQPALLPAPASTNSQRRLRLSARSCNLCACSPSPGVSTWTPELPPNSPQTPELTRGPSPSPRPHSGGERAQAYLRLRSSRRVPDGRDGALNEGQRGGEAGFVLALVAEAVRREVLCAHEQTDGHRRRCAVVEDEAQPPALLLLCSRDRVQALVLAPTAHDRAVCVSSPDRRHGESSAAHATPDICGGRARRGVFAHGRHFSPVVESRREALIKTEVRVPADPSWIPPFSTLVDVSDDRRHSGRHKSAKSVIPRI